MFDVRRWGNSARRTRQRRTIIFFVNASSTLNFQCFLRRKCISTTQNVQIRTSGRSILRTRPGRNGVMVLRSCQKTKGMYLPLFHSYLFIIYPPICMATHIHPLHTKLGQRRSSSPLHGFLPNTNLQTLHTGNHCLPPRRRLRRQLGHDHVLRRTSSW